MSIQKIDDTGKMLVLTPIPGMGVQFVADGHSMGIMRIAEVNSLIASLRTAATLVDAKYE